MPNPNGRLISGFIVLLPITANASSRICGERYDNNAIIIDFANSDSSVDFGGSEIAYTYSDYGTEYNLKNYDYVCFDALITEVNEYDVQFIHIQNIEYKCASDRMVGSNECEQCPTGARATKNKGEYHTNTRANGCDWCDDEYYYEYKGFYSRCHLCGANQNANYDSPTYHQLDKSYCDCIENHYMDWDTNTCKRCPCNGHNGPHMPLYECFLEAGQTCEDETGTYTVSEGCYGYEY